MPREKKKNQIVATGSWNGFICANIFIRQISMMWNVIKIKDEYFVYDLSIELTMHDEFITLIS